MTIRTRATVFIAGFLLLVFTVPGIVVLVRAAAEPCRNETICSQYPIWHIYYWTNHCDKEPCPQEPM
jgi:hypothetical protein